MPIPLVPLAVVAATALLMGNGEPGSASHWTAPAGAPKQFQPGTHQYLAEVSDPAALYAASLHMYSQGHSNDAEALLAACNYFRGQAGQAPLPYPPTKEVGVSLFPAPT